MELVNYTLKNDTAKAFHLLSKGLYKAPLESAFREILANAVDACEESESKFFPIVEYSNDVVSIKDFGKGMTEEFLLNTFSSYFSSTKGDNEKATGSFGLGCKAPFAVSDSFDICTTCKGITIKATAYLDDQGMPQLTVLSKEGTSSQSGTEIFFNVVKESRYHVEKAIEKLSTTIIKPFYVKNKYTNNQMNLLSHIKASGVYELAKVEDELLVAVNSILYRVDLTNLDDRLVEVITSQFSKTGKKKVVIVANKSEVTIQPSRESLVYSKQTIQFIESELKKIFTHSFFIQSYGKNLREWCEGTCGLMVHLIDYILKGTDEALIEALDEYYLPNETRELIISENKKHKPFGDFFRKNKIIAISSRGAKERGLESIIDCLNLGIKFTFKTAKDNVIKVARGSKGTQKHRDLLKGLEVGTLTYLIPEELKDEFESFGYKTTGELEIKDSSEDEKLLDFLSRTYCRCLTTSNGIIFKCFKDNKIYVSLIDKSDSIISDSYKSLIPHRLSRLLKDTLEDGTSVVGVTTKTAYKKLIEYGAEPIENLFKKIENELASKIKTKSVEHVAYSLAFHMLKQKTNSEYSYKEVTTKEYLESSLVKKFNQNKIWEEKLYLVVDLLINSNFLCNNETLQPLLKEIEAKVEEITRAEYPLFRLIKVGDYSFEEALHLLSM